MDEKILLQRIGQRIREIRAAKGISQQELAARLEYEKSNMSRLESGRVNPRLTTLYSVAQALEITLPELLQLD